MHAKFKTRTHAYTRMLKYINLPCNYSWYSSFT